MKRKISVCIVSNDFPPNIVGGQGIYARDLAENLSKKGFEIKVIVPSDDHLSKDYMVYATGRASNPLKFCWLARKKLMDSKIGEIDILHGNGINHLFFCLFKPKSIKKIITTTHNTYLQRFTAKNLIWKILYIPFILLEKITLTRSDKIISVSEATKKSVLNYRISLSKVDVVLNGVDFYKFSSNVPKGYLRKTLKLSSNSKIMLFVGRLEKRKNVRFVINLFKYLSRVLPQLHCVIVGQGGEEQNLKKLTEELGMKSRIHFLGYILNDDLPQVYRDADLFILPSRGEGFPFVLIEAACSSLPLIATKEATGGSGILKNGENGYFIDTRNLDNAALKLKECLLDQKAMSKKSREIGKYYSLETSIRRTIEVYKSLGLD